MEFFALLFIAVMFGLPVFASVQAKKAKERQMGSSRPAQPLTEEELEFLRSLRDEPEQEVEAEAQKSAPAAPAPQTEGQRTITSATRKPKKAVEEKEAEKEKIDGKKLILYSEIMKPKFDE